MTGGLTPLGGDAADHSALWTGGTGDWGDPGNWDIPTAPGTFPLNGLDTYDAELLNGGTIQLDQDIVIEGFTLGLGTLGGAFSLTLNENLIWDGGGLEGTGTLTAMGTGSTITGTGFSYLDRRLANSGTMVYSATDAITPLYFGWTNTTPGILDNSGTFNVTSGGDFAEFWSLGHVINNSGTWNVSGLGTTSTVGNGILFNNSGAVAVQSGRLALSGGGTSIGSFTPAGGAVVDIIGGTYNLEAGGAVGGAGDLWFSGGETHVNGGSYAVTGTTRVTGGIVNFNTAASTAAFELSSGTLRGSAAVSVGGSMAWTGGGMEGTGSTTVAGAGSTMTGASFSYLDRTLTNTGTIAYSAIDATTPLYFGWTNTTPGVLNNAGTFNVTSGGDFAEFWSLPGQAINNSGTWNVSGPGTTSTVGNGVPYNNTGTVAVQSGTLALSGGGTSSGNYAVSSGATLDFAGGTHTLNTGGVINGSGLVRFSGGETTVAGGTYAVTGTTSVAGGIVNVDAAASTGALEVSDGTQRGSATLSASGNLTWTGGILQGTGTTTVGGSGSSIEGAGFKALDRVLTNTGTMTYSAIDITTPLYLGWTNTTPGVLNNAGTFNVTSGGDFSEFWSIPGQGINNSGIWNVSGAGTTSVVAGGLVFNNTGTVAVLSGSLSLVAPTVTQYVADALTAGRWQVFAGAEATLPTTGIGVVVNQADVTLSGAGSQLRSGVASDPLESVLNSNQGALRILGGRNYASVGALTNSGDLELGGGTFSAPGLTNSAAGEVFGFGTITVRPTNSGLIRSVGGTLAFGNGIQGGSGTVQIDPGSILDLSGGASGSSADFLIHNGTSAGSLNLGTNNFTVGADYTNTNFGSGNGFSPRANVSGSGQILAAGGIAQTISGTAVTGGGTGTPTLGFGNIHVGDEVTRTYQVNNVGASGPVLRGALQTSVNGGSITDPRLSGAGVTAGNFGPISTGSATGAFSVVLTGTTAGALTGQNIHIINNFDNVGDQTMNVTGSVFRYALPTAHTPEPVAFGNFHVGDVAPSQVLSLTNNVANDGFSEALNASIGGATGGVTTNGGAFSLLGPGATNSTALSVGIDTATAGSKNGTATISLASDGTGSSGLGLTALSSQTVNVTGSVFRLAQPTLPGGTAIDFGIAHVGDTLQQSIDLTNAALNDGFSESLNASFSSTTGDVGATGSITGLTAGGSLNTLSVSLNTATAGNKNGSASIALTSDGSGTSALGLTALPSQSVTVTGLVNDFANPVFVLDAGPAVLSGGGTSYTLDFGTRVVGDPLAIAQISLINDVPAPADSLAGSFDDDTPTFMLSGFDAFVGLAAGQTRSGFLASLPTDTLGDFEESVTLLGLGQNPSGYNGALADVTITLRGQIVVPEPGTAALLALGLLVGWRRRR
ncbi:MAG: beta strand repeat-containing protein [Verrucomicrobiales bacterium]